MRLSDVEDARRLAASIPQLPSVSLILRQEAVELDVVPPSMPIMDGNPEKGGGLSSYEQATYPAVLPL